MIFGLEILTKIRLFSGMAPEEVEAVISNGHYRSYQKGECVVREGEPCRAFGIVAGGSIVLRKESAAGESQVVAKMAAGQLFGEALVYSTAKKWPVTIWATENSGIYFLDLTGIRKAQTYFPESYDRLLQNFLRELSDKTLHLNQKLEYLALKKMRGKLAKYLLAAARQQGSDYFQIPLNRNELADFLAVARTSMSRELAKMKADGLLDYHKNQFKILDPIAMEKAVE